MPKAKKKTNPEDRMDAIESKQKKLEEMILELSKDMIEVTELLNETVDELNDNGTMTHKAASRLGIE